jgi:DNA repair exonuclease SbcCD ATPase subunit
MTKRKVRTAHLVKTQDITASWDQSPFKDTEEAQIDKESNTIKNVCLMGTRYSKNGYTYLDQALDSLTQKAEGANFYVNHPSKSEAKDRDGVRDIRHWGGIFRNSRREGDKVFADLTVRESFWPLVYDVAMMKPLGIGNSINARVQVFKDDKNRESVLDVDRLRSVDLVASAATTQNLWESVPDDVDETEDEEREAIGAKTRLEEIDELEEGVLKDKLKQKEVERAINDLQWNASDIINDILREKDKSFADKRKQIGSVLDDLDTEIGKLMKGQGLKTENTNNGKEEDMDLNSLTLEMLQKDRPDLVDAIKDAIEGAENIKAMEEENKTLKTENEDLKKGKEDLEKENEDLKKENEDLKKENETMKKELDEFKVRETKSKKETFINDKVKELKVPADAVTEYYKTDLMSKDEEEIVKSLEDRKQAWNKGSGDVTGSGDEKSLTEDETEEQKAKTDKAEVDFVESMKS